MINKIVTRKSLKKVRADKKYVGCTFYLQKIGKKHMKNFVGVVFENCSFRGETHVDLCAANLTCIPSWIFSISSIRSLHLDNNQIKVLPTDIKNLTYLEKLTLDNNRLQEIPRQIGQLSYLEYLCLSKNQLQNLPSEIGNLTNLQELHLHSNQMTKLPNSLQKLSNLRHLNLHRNQLTELPKILLQLPKLEELCVYQNNFNEVYPPWITFMGYKAGYIGWRMGDGEDWWHNVFRIFWQALSCEEKCSYVDKWNADESWREHLERMEKNFIPLSKKSRGIASNIHDAAEIGNFSALKSFIEQGVDVNLPNSIGWTPLRYAVTWGNVQRRKLGNIEITKYLLQNGANPNLGHEGDTPLFYAASAEIAQVLIENGALVNKRDDNGNTPLFYTSEIEVTQVLIAAGADINAVNHENRNVLFHLFYDDEVDLIAFLIRAGVHVNLQNNEGETPLHLAIRFASIKTIEIVLKAGANPYVIDDNGDTPFDLNNNKDIQTLLRSYAKNFK